MAGLTSQREHRRRKLLAGLSLRDLTGLEIGPLCRPFVVPDEGRVIYVDHADTATLRNKYAADPNVDVNAIVDVGAVWGGKTLHEAVGAIYVDYVVASHVVEHVPDFVSWLGEVAAVLKPTGDLRLIVPDRRFTFDFFRRETQLADVLLSYMAKARVPQPHCLLDFILNVIDVPPDPWRRTPVRPAAGELPAKVPRALQLARGALEQGHYHDVHCWVFTPHSFAGLMEALVGAELTDFACEGFHDTSHDEIDFFVMLRRTSDRAYAADSWRRMAHAVRALARQPSGEVAAAPCADFAGRRAPGRPDALDAKRAAGLPPGFSPAHYLDANPDVAEAGEDAALHYLAWGWGEGRPLGLV